MAASRSVSFLGGLIVAAGAYYAVSVDVLKKLEESQSLLKRVNANLRTEMGGTPDNTSDDTKNDIVDHSSAVPHILTVYWTEKDRLFNSIIPRTKSAWNSEIHNAVNRLHQFEINVQNWSWSDKKNGPKGKDQ
ncbi:hypothetical protein H4R33_000977 [Dimargaris cristalligena]|nr:hypothetical protein H4R33_000977 [Dimargaris cristalligena]